LKKYYLCLVVGTVEKGGHLSGYLKKDRTTNRVEVLPEPERGAEQIETEYEPLRTLDCKGEVLTLLQIHLITGKSHQIRAHMASIGHPVVGDAKYGNRTARAICPEVKHQLLHAWRLELGTPEYLLEKYWGMTWEAKLPEIWNKFL
jgi:23S rRNA pseudouridine955/2504/2580 synthase